MIAMPANTESQFNLFDRPSSPVDRQAPQQKRRAHLHDLVQGVGQLENEELIDLIRVAIGEARRRGIGSASPVGESSQRTVPAEDQTAPTAGRIGHQTAPMGDIPPAKANMIRAAVRAGIRPGRVAKDFGVAVAIVRKVAAT
jgi:hypothetical protein